MDCYISIWEEHRFWLKILDDHAHFVRDYLSPTEKKYVKTAQKFIDDFRYFRKRLTEIPSETDVSSPVLITFAKEVQPLASSYYQFESHLQYLRLRNEVNLNLTPSFLTGTLLENQEYLRLLQYMVRGEQPPMQSLTALLDLWLEDQAGHAELLANGLDPLEEGPIEQAQTLARQFIWFQFKNSEIKKMHHFTQARVPEQGKFVHQVIQAVLTFNQLVLGMLEEYKQKQLFNRLTYRFLVHHLPETCYFLTKLACFLPLDSKLIPNCTLTPPYFSE